MMVTNDMHFDPKVKELLEARYLPMLTNENKLFFGNRDDKMSPDVYFAEPTAEERTVVGDAASDDDDQMDFADGDDYVLIPHPIVQLFQHYRETFIDTFHDDTWRTKLIPMGPDGPTGDKTADTFERDDAKEMAVRCA